MRRVWIKRWLLEKGMTQAEIAREAGVSYPLVSLTIKGQRSFDGPKGKKVKDALIKRGCPWQLLEIKAV